jgi:hypothetical protein
VRASLLFRSLGLGIALSGFLQLSLWAQAPDSSDPVLPGPSPSAPVQHNNELGKSNRDVRTGQDSKADVTLGEDPDNRLIVPFVKHLAIDQRTFWTTPAHFRVQDLRWAVPFVGATAAFIAGDSWISKQIPLSKVQSSKTISDYGVYSLIAAGGGAFVLGHLTGDDHMSEAGLLSGEAAINSTAVAFLMKSATQRPRPFQSHGSGVFFQGGTSFPSEHAAIAWSVASVMAHEYPGTLTKILAYGLATGISATRVTGQQHFASDVIIGSALGWYFGRQVYRAHHDADLGGDSWGDLVPESSGERERNPADMGSPYVPLDSWVYPALERLIALGYIRSGYLGIRPWTRMECARMLEEAEQNIADQDDTSSTAAPIYTDLAKEFEPETARLNGAANLGASVDSVYVRATNISGPPLRDGYHFGQTIINDYGRPYGEGFNANAGVSTHAEAGPLYVYFRGEYQQAPAIASDPASVLQAIASADVTASLPNGTAQIRRFRMLEGSVGLRFQNIQFSFGKQNLWLGPGQSGPFLFSNNAEGVMMLRVDNVAPFHFPVLSTIFGPARMDFSIGQLSGHTWDYNAPNLVGPRVSPQPFIHENKVSFKPLPDLEFGFGVTAIFGGPGLPFTWNEFLRSYYSHKASVAAGNPAKRFSGFDISYRVPGLRKWLMVYNDSLVVDEISPIGSTRPLLSPGIYLPQLPKIPKLELRVEGMKNGGLPHNFSPGFDYYDARYRSGYTNNGNLMGAWIRASIAGQAWAKYSFSSRTNLQFGYRHDEVDRHFIGGGRSNDFWCSTELMLGRHTAISSLLQYENWRFPVLQAAPQSNVTAQIGVTFSPAWRVQKKDR